MSSEFAASSDDADQNYLVALECGVSVVAQGLQRVEASSRWRRSDDRAKKMAKIVEAQRGHWRSLDVDQPPTQATLGSLTGSWPAEAKVRLLIDLSAGDPFAPYTVKFKRSDLVARVEALAPAIGVSKRTVDEIEAARRSAARAYQTSTVRKAAAAGLMVAVAAGSAGWLAAPALGAALGTSAGLTGAAATAHGLALLGGGSIASGGMGMAGGMWLVAGTSATAGLIGGSGSTLLYDLGAAETRSELVKLQVTFKVAVLGTQRDLLKAQAAIMGLMEREAELRRILEAERELNDENSARLKELAEKLEDVIAARSWMEEEVSHA